MECELDKSWLLSFREVFQVVEDMLCMPKLYTSIPTCMLRVVNNDTGEEIPRIFQKVAPYVYKKNTVSSVAAWFCYVMNKTIVSFF